MVILDGNAIESRAALHDTLQSQLGLPEWYGRNLDALHDCLTERCEPTEIVIRDLPALTAHLGPYAQALCHMLYETAAECPALTVTAEENG